MHTAVRPERKLPSTQTSHIVKRPEEKLPSTQRDIDAAVRPERKLLAHKETFT